MKDERGAALVWVVLLMVVFLGFVALVTDVGALHVVRRQMVTAADAAALAGAKELALTGDKSAAVAVAGAYAEANRAEIVVDISVDTVDYNGVPFQAVVVNVGRYQENFFAKALGFDGQNVMARAVATYGTPVSCGEILPIFYVIAEGEDLPEGERLLLGERLTPGNWGFLALEPPGQNTIDDVLSGGETYYFEGEVGDTIEADTKTGNAHSRINAVEDRMKLARDLNDPTIMHGVIPILREITSGGKTEVVIVGFAPFKITDIITKIVKEEENMWYGRGSEFALFVEPGHPGKLYGEGYDKRADASDVYPTASIIGEFLEDQFIPASQVGEITQNPDYQFGLYTIRLIE